MLKPLAIITLLLCSASSTSVLANEDTAKGESIAAPTNAVQLVKKQRSSARVLPVEQLLRGRTESLSRSDQLNNDNTSLFRTDYRVRPRQRAGR